MQGVFTHQRLNENEDICAASCLWFSSESKLSQFLSRPGHSQWSDRCLKVEQVPKGGEFSTLYGVLVGVAGEINHG